MHWFMISLPAYAIKLEDMADLTNLFKATVKAVKLREHSLQLIDKSTTAGQQSTDGKGKNIIFLWDFMTNINFLRH